MKKISNKNSKMILNMTDRQGNANQNPKEISPYTC